MQIIIRDTFFFLYQISDPLIITVVFRHSQTRMSVRLKTNLAIFSSEWLQIIKKKKKKNLDVVSYFKFQVSSNIYGV